MTNDKKEDKKNNSKYIFSLFMLLIYFGMSYLLIFSELFSQQYSSFVRIIIGLLFFVYGIFRAYRIIRTKKHIIKDEN